MLIAFVESRPKKAGKSEVWEDVLLARLEVLAPPQIGWVIRIPSVEGGKRRYRVREIVQELPVPGDGERVTDQELVIFIVPIPPSGTLEMMAGRPRVGLFGDEHGGAVNPLAAGVV